jgi:hypothetical protein
VQELLGFSCVRPLRTVAAFLEEGGAGALLDDPLLEVATAEIVAGDRPRAQVQRDIKHKERAREALSRKYRYGTVQGGTFLRDDTQSGEGARHCTGRKVGWEEVKGRHQAQGAGTQGPVTQVLVCVIVAQVCVAPRGGGGGGGWQRDI